jgi:hypothetical protein
LATSAVTDLVSTRIYFDYLEQNSIFPAIVIEDVGADPAEHLTGLPGLEAHEVDVTLHGTDRIDSLRNAVIDALGGASGVLDSMDVREISDLNSDETRTPSPERSGAWRIFCTINCTVWIKR